MVGTVKQLNSERGFGFIRGADGKDYFFHRSAVEKPGRFEEIREEDRVEFEPTETAKGLRAECVEIP